MMKQGCNTVLNVHSIVKDGQEASSSYRFSLCSRLLYYY